MAIFPERDAPHDRTDDKLRIDLQVNLEIRRARGLDCRLRLSKFAKPQAERRVHASVASRRMAMPASSALSKAR